MSEAGSGIEGLRNDSAFARYVAGRLSQESFKLVDVGCAGGVATGWRAFGDRLSGIGFDINAAEVERLNAAEVNPGVRYVAGWVGMPDGHPLKSRIGSKAFWHHWPSGRLAYERTHNLRKARSEGLPAAPLERYFDDVVLGEEWLTTPATGFDLDYGRTFDVFPVEATEVAAQPPAGPDPVIHLPPFLKSFGFYDADFLKLDIDGPDYEVLRSVSDLLTQPSLLGVSLEVSFYGSHDANDNSFHNMDRLMREKGFDLFGLSVRTYASAALPFPYLDAHPSMNTGGRPIQGDALYVRDLGSRVRKEVAAQLSDEKLAKLAALFALFTLPDSAAEILLVHRERLSRVLDVEHALDLLAAEIQPTEVIDGGYKGYVAAFEREDPRFFGVYWAQNAWMNRIIQTANDAPEMETRLARAEADAHAARAELAALRDALAVEQREAGQARAHAEAIERSTAWRLTEPLRRLASLLPGRRSQA